MGLIKAGLGALGGVLADQWKEYFYCESMKPEILVSKGQKKVNGRSSNKRGEENVISTGSVIAVNEGQCMLIVEQGKVVEVCAEPGEFVYDSTTQPSIFCGNLGETVSRSFQEVGKRFGFGGTAATDQRVYFINTKEIYGNKYGTPTPVPFRIVDEYINLRTTVSIRCHGEYSYKIVDPLMFYTNVCNNVANEFEREEIDSQLKSEVLMALQPVFAEISSMGIDYTELPAHTLEISKAMNKALSESWKRLGLEIVVFGISSVAASEEDEERLKELQRNAALKDPRMAAAHLAGAQAQAMQNAAKNEGGMGAMGGFFGMNMAGGAGSNVNNLYATAQAEEANTAQNAPVSGWTCSCGKSGNTGKFCSECGKPKPVENKGWTCSCGKTGNTGKFCSECGAKRPVGAPVYQCDKCGWKPADPLHPPKFCPECGDPFDDNDRK